MTVPQIWDTKVVLYQHYSPRGAEALHPSFTLLRPIRPFRAFATSTFSGLSRLTLDRSVSHSIYSAPLYRLVFLLSIFVSQNAFSTVRRYSRSRRPSCCGNLKLSRLLLPGSLPDTDRDLHFPRNRILRGQMLPGKIPLWRSAGRQVWLH